MFIREQNQGKRRGAYIFYDGYDSAHTVVFVPLILCLCQNGAYWQYPGNEPDSGRHVHAPVSISDAYIFVNVPKELEESARIDGANTAQVIWHVLRPVVSPGLITVSILIGLQSWNEYLISSTFLQGAKNFTATLGFLSMNGAYGSNMSILMAASVILIAPIIIFSCARRSILLTAW